MNTNPSKKAREQKADAVMLIEAGMPHNFKYGYVTVRVPK